MITQLQGRGLSSWAPSEVAGQDCQGHTGAAHGLEHRHGCGDKAQPCLRSSQEVSLQVGLIFVS